MKKLKLANFPRKIFNELNDCTLILKKQMEQSFSVSLPYLYLAYKGYSNAPLYKIPYPSTFHQLITRIQKKFGPNFNIEAIFDEDGARIDEKYQIIPGSKLYISDNSNYSQCQQPKIMTRKSPKKITHFCSDEKLDRLFPKDAPKSPAKFNEKENLMFFEEEPDEKIAINEEEEETYQ